MINHRITFTALIFAVGALSLGIVADGNEPSDAPASGLSLTSGYSSDGAMGGLEARSIRFSLARTVDGWKGSMSLDSNILNFSNFGRTTESTLMTAENVDIVLRRVGKDEGNGRECFEVIQSRFAPKMCLVFPRHPSGTYRLIVGGPAVTHVVLLEAEWMEMQVASR